jgi:hypothetical protein
MRIVRILPSVLLSLSVLVAAAVAHSDETSEAEALFSAFEAKCLRADGSGPGDPDESEASHFLESMVLSLVYGDGKPGAHLTVLVLAQEKDFEGDEFSEVSDGAGLSCFGDIPLGKLRVVTTFEDGAAASFVRVGANDSHVRVAIDRSAGTASAAVVAPPADAPAVEVSEAEGQEDPDPIVP